MFLVLQFRIGLLFFWFFKASFFISLAGKLDMPLTFAICNYKLVKYWFRNSNWSTPLHGCVEEYFKWRYEFGIKLISGDLKFVVCSRGTLKLVVMKITHITTLGWYSYFPLSCRWFFACHVYIRWMRNQLFGSIHVESWSDTWSLIILFKPILALILT